PGCDPLNGPALYAPTYLPTLSPELPCVTGFHTDQDDDLLFSSDRAATRVSVFRCSDERLLGQVEVGPHPNGLAYDRRRRHLFSFNLGNPLGENCTASVVDPESFCVIAEVPLPGVPDVVMQDHELQRLYVAIGEPGVVSVFDSERLEPLEQVETEQGAHTTGWDPIGRCLYVFCPASSGAAVYEERG